MTYVNRTYDTCITKTPGTAMTICDFPRDVKAALHESCFPANTKAGFQVLEFVL
jgi:hypothetical protein